jgi:hypothetical protein
VATRGFTKGIGSILASADDGTLTADPHLRRPDGGEMAPIRRKLRCCPKISQKSKNMRQKGHNDPPASRDKHLSSGVTADFGDNAINGIVAFWAQYWRRLRKSFDWK